MMSRGRVTQNDLENISSDDTSIEGILTEEHESPGSSLSINDILVLVVVSEDQIVQLLRVSGLFPEKTSDIRQIGFALSLRVQGKSLSDSFGSGLGKGVSALTDSKIDGSESRDDAVVERGIARAGNGIGSLSLGEGELTKEALVVDGGVEGLGGSDEEDGSEDEDGFHGGCK